LLGETGCSLKHSIPAAILLFQNFQRSSNVIPGNFRQTKPIRRKVKMKRSFLVMVTLGLTLCLAGAPAWGDDFYVIAGGGSSGKVLKTQVFTSGTARTTIGTSTWAPLDWPLWTYTKMSATSYLVITYQDTLALNGNGQSYYQLRVDDQPSVAGPNGALLACVPTAGWWGNNPPTPIIPTIGSYSATGVWTGLAKGNHTLSIWHRVTGPGPFNGCEQNSGGNTTSVIVMEIEN
jgi:hypothetical protein